MTSPVSLGQALVAPELRPPNLGGAGHWLDCVYPTRYVNQLDQNPGANNNDSLIRGTFGSVAGIRGAIGAGGTDALILAASTIICQQMPSTAAGGLFFGMIGAVWHGALGPPNANPQSLIPNGFSPWAVCRCIMYMATENIVPAANRDIGFAFIQPTAGTNQPYQGLFNQIQGTGIALNRNTNGKWSLDTRQAAGGAVTRTELNVSANVFHTLEFRFFEATQTRFAYYEFYVDGINQTALIPVNQRVWGGTTILPSGDLNGNRYSGFVPSLISNAGANGSQLYIRYLRVIQSDTLASALT